MPEPTKQLDCSNGAATVPLSGGSASLASQGALCLSGTWTGTLAVQGRVHPNGAWINLPLTPLGGGAAVTTVAANGQWRYDASGLAQVQLAVSVVGTGTAVVDHTPIVG